MRTRTLISFDYAVKKLLRNKADYEVLEGFLSELFKRRIMIKTILESESNKEQEDSKQNRVDMLVSDETDELFIIEIQFTREIDYFHRMLFGVSKALLDHIDKGNAYSVVKKIYSVNIVYFDFGTGKDYVYYGKTHFTGLHEKDELQLSEKQRDTFGKTEAGDLFPEYYILKVNTFDDIAKDTLDEWIYYFKHSKIEEGFKAQGLQKAAEVLDESRLTPEEMRAYEKAIDTRRSNDSSLLTAQIEGEAIGMKKGVAIGIEKGVAIGMEKGVAVGLAEGEAKGKAEGERLKTLEIVTNSHKNGLPAETMAAITGLSAEEVLAVVNSWK
jgi:predicted transposase/invertase (TIGR01784 family)